MITFEQVWDTAESIVKAHPRKRNPRAKDGLLEGMCLYNGPRNRHCLGGEVLLALGKQLPQEGTPVDWTPDRDDFTGSAMSLLVALQRSADTRNARNKSRTWRQAWDHNIVQRLHPEYHQ